MSEAGARGLARIDNNRVAAVLVIAKWLRFGAAPAFAVMTLLTMVPAGGAPVVLCSAADFGLNGMAPMYLLMTVIHLGPWLNFISRR